MTTRTDRMYQLKSLISEGEGMEANLLQQRKFATLALGMLTPRLRHLRRELHQLVSPGEHVWGKTEPTAPVHCLLCQVPRNTTTPCQGPSQPCAN